MILDTPPTSESPQLTEYDYVIVGSGAGGAPLAARLAECGYSILVLEAGPNHAGKSPGLPGKSPDLPEHEISEVPAFHGPSTERDELSWRYWVSHYADNTYPNPTQIDPKFNVSNAGVFYPRATGVGGCTIHNAMITIAGPGADWNQLAWYLNDPSWSADVMRGYFRRLEHCDYLKPWRRPRNLFEQLWENLLWLFGKDLDPTVGRHGFDGWLHTSTVDLTIGLSDPQLIKMLKAAAITCQERGLEAPKKLVDQLLVGQVGEALDPNHFRRQAERPEGLALVPTAVVGRQLHYGPDRGHRSSPVRQLLESQSNPDRKLSILTNCLVTKVILEKDHDGVRATGVEYLHGAYLYSASRMPAAVSQTAGKIHARREVILCGGSFSTPQLLMLSGIGPREHLEKIGVKCEVDSPGVGGNLQDRYEATVVSKMRHQFGLLNGATFKLPVGNASADPLLDKWRKTGGGLYASNGAVLSILKRSKPDLDQPDLFIFGIPLKFQGYEVGYSDVKPSEFDLFTWAILKGHTENRGGTVRLRSMDPRDTPVVNFNYFGTTETPPRINDPDLDALLHGVKFVRDIAGNAKSVVHSEYHPATTMGVAPDATDQQLKDWIKQIAWGHHACGTCRMGRRDDPMAVTDSQFRVLGSCLDRKCGNRGKVKGLRIVDASIFTTIPGYFIVSNLYMASEKAADVIGGR